MTMHRPGPARSELGFLSPVYSTIPGFGHTADQQELNRGGVDAVHSVGESITNASWERRCLRKHRRRPGNEGCSPKRRRLMGEVGSALWDVPGPKQWPGWAPHSGGSELDPAPGLQLGPSPTQTQPCPVPEISLGYPGTPPPPPQPCPKPEGSRMEVEAAQRRLQEIEERITLEDDDEDDDLDVEPAQNRPVLVMSQSLREGLQQGFGDILPHTVAESVSRSCMELVVWRPPEEALPRRLKDSLQKQRKQAACRQTPSTVSPQPPAAPESPAHSGLYCNPTPQASTEEEMEL
ncbi:hypothetical protein SKAU_G00000980 [Synaphobranchus kaupii]|uniref:Coiled-coil domain-containing protein 117 n=1 Tax=Synaphobranchus kaupii TaxID=118154 RepID=A0A9Q1JC16_SYNKA|nr:hypothetical protein SKAU_G00000980 [Synaphobranchus kaupii]